MLGDRLRPFPLVVAAGATPWSAEDFAWVARVSRRRRNPYRYHDSASIVDLIRAKAAADDPAEWTRLSRRVADLRCQERAEFKAAVLQQAAEGNWAALRHRERRNGHVALSAFIVHHGGVDKAVDHLKTFMLNKFGEEDVAARRDWDAELERLQGLAVSCAPEPFTLEELTIACASMKRNRATGPDSVSAELLSQFLFSDVAGCLRQLYNDVLLHKRAFPHAWTQHAAVLIPKVASPQLGKHLRPIVLSSVLQKLLAKMLWNRVSPVVSSYTGGQVGCRPHAQAAEAVFACRALIDKAKEWRLPLVGLKLDVSQAFDRVHQVAFGLRT